MKKVLVAAVLLLCTAAPLAAIFLYESARTKDITVEIFARAPERGNFLPRRVTVPVGKEVKLRVRNVDTVTHGFTIPAMEVNTGEIKAGHQADLVFTPQEVGEYDFYCTVWCGDHHMQMRGVLEVTGKADTLSNSR